MTDPTRWTFLLAMAAALALLGACDGDTRFLGDDDDSAGDDDDTTVPEFECPYQWDGIPEGIPREDWAVIALMAQGNQDFSLQEHNFDNYKLWWVTWNDDEYPQYESEYTSGPCFRDAAGLYRGSEAVYGDVLYSVSARLDDPISWYGTIQAIPLNGAYPYAIGTVGTLRGHDLVGDGIGGFVVCGSTDPEKDNEWVIWLDGDGVVVAEFDMPEGSCYDLDEADDGTYWVVSPDAEKVWNLDIDSGTFTEIGSIPSTTSWPNQAWFVQQMDADTLMLAGDVGGYSAVYTLGTDGSGPSFLADKPVDSATQGSVVTNIQYYEPADRHMIATADMDMPVASWYGPCLARTFAVNETSSSYDYAWGYGTGNGDLIVDFYPIDLGQLF